MLVRNLGDIATKSNSKLLVSSAITAALALGTAAIPTDADAAKGGMEKCYGVVKKGQNDCGSSTHSCAGQATQDKDSNEWIYLTKGTCDKLVGGKTK